MPFQGSPAPGPHPDIENCMPRGSADGLRDDQLETMELVSAGPLAERVLSALVEERPPAEEKDQDKEKPKRVRKDSISSDAKGKGPATSEKSALTAVHEILLDWGVCTFEYLRNNLLIIQIDEEGTSTSFFSC